MAAHSTCHDGSHNIRGPVIEREQAKGFLMFGSATVEERGSFTKWTNRLFTSEIADNPYRNGREDETDKNVDIFSITINPKTDSSRDNARDDNVKENG